MKATFPLWWHVLAVSFAAVGAGIVLLFLWTFLVLVRIEPVDGVLQALSGDSLPALRASRPWVSIAWASGRPAFNPAARERSAEERLAASADLLDFVESIRRHPVSGGHYLALKAYDFCTREARLTRIASLDVLRDLVGRVALELAIEEGGEPWPDRCAGVLHDERVSQANNT